MPHKQWSTFTERFWAKKSFTEVRSSNMEITGLTGVVYMTLFRTIMEQENKHRAQGGLESGDWALWIYCVSGQVEYYKKMKILPADMAFQARMTPSWVY